MGRWKDRFFGWYDYFILIKSLKLRKGESLTLTEEKFEKLDNRHSWLDTFLAWTTFRRSSYLHYLQNKLHRKKFLTDKAQVSRTILIRCWNNCTFVGFCAWLEYSSDTFRLNLISMWEFRNLFPEATVPTNRKTMKTKERRLICRRILRISIWNDVDIYVYFERIKLYFRLNFQVKFEKKSLIRYLI